MTRPFPVLLASIVVASSALALGAIRAPEPLPLVDAPRPPARSTSCCDVDPDMCGARTPPPSRLSKVDVLRVVQAHRRATQLCVGSGAPVRVRWWVDAAGMPGRVEVLNRETVPVATQRCLLAEVGAWRFPARAEPLDVPITFPFRGAR